MQTRNIILNGHRWSVTLRDDADESVANEIFKFREYRIVEPFIAQATHAIFDIGAHSGLFSLYVRSFNAGAPIIAFEPEPKNFAVLTKHIEVNQLKNITLVKKAIARASGKRKLVITPDNLNHFLSPDKNLFSKKETVAVEARSLADALNDHHVSRVSLVKMDIEGGEYDIIEVLTPELASKVEAFLLEYHDNKGDHKKLEEQFRERGFSVQTFPSHFEKTMGFIFARNKRILLSS